MSLCRYVIVTLSRCVVISLFVLCLVSCEEQKHEPEDTLKSALVALNEGNYDAYLQRVDFGAEMDSAQVRYMRAVLRHHLGWRRSECPAVVSIDVQDVIKQSDSVCTVYYQYTFADNTKEIGAQKMVRHGETWKLRLRN